MTEIETPKPSLRPEQNLVGKVLNNNYRIERLIGAGGMGEVYEGEHLFTGNRVAIKAVLQALSHDEKVLGLFKREARILFKLTDEAVARYLDSFHEPVVDRYCLVMDFIDGAPLSERMVIGQPLSEAEARRLMRRMAVALERAHRLEIVHRDLSPDNIMLGGGDVDQAVLIDFGIARAATMAESTLHGQFAGKFKYVSPEQLGHFGGEVGPRTDIYGLALLIAAGLRGKALDMGTSIVEAVNARRAIPALEGVPPGLAPLLAHMLEPDPAHRPADMAAVVRMLDAPRLVPPLYAPWAAAAGAPGDRTVIAAPLGMGAAPGSLPPGTMSQSLLQTGSFAGASQPPDDWNTGGFPSGSFATGTGAAGDFRTGGFAASQPSISQPPLSQRPGAMLSPGTSGFTGLPQPSGPPAAPARQGRGLLWAGLATVALAGLGGAGWYLTLGPGAGGPAPAPPQIASPETPPAGTPAAETPAAALPPPDTATREGFLAAFRPDVPCSVAMRVTAGGNSGKLAVLGDAPGKLPGIADAYGSTFGATPAVLDQRVSAEQCPVLALMRALQGRAVEPPLVTLDADVVPSGGSVIARIAGLEGRTIWLFLVSGTGAVFDLTERLEMQPDGSAVLAVGLKSDTGKPEPQLIVALASPVALVSAATAAPGVAAKDLMPAVLAEIASRKLSVGARAAVLTLTP
ncbi:serine/threonine-protein kinase [Rhodobacter viridis]|uniref:Serine/threonine-protein kinase n=1 Tax=Rhodobacter viridis TaxID=1054202 RepID=A0A318TXW6_9RHOB|nr:serine/threonine-protein kinase [Rhodobacter viridis]PYF09886.1 serine/threonine-protein kinase [Rhodobacter viridis]